MAMLRKLSRLFVIKTRFEAWAVTYVIALGAVERARAYLESYPGAAGWMLAAACTGVVFLAGAKLLDSVRPAEPQAPPAMAGSGAWPRRVSHIRPTVRRLGAGGRPRRTLRKD